MNCKFINSQRGTEVGKKNPLKIFMKKKKKTFSRFNGSNARTTYMKRLPHNRRLIKT